MSQLYGEVHVMMQCKGNMFAPNAHLLGIMA